VKKKKNLVRNGGGIPVPPGLQPVENGMAAIGMVWNGQKWLS
jgi:hypothetical protein